MNEDIIYEILSVVEEIPAGRVATYGQIARLIGREKNARLVGKVLSQAEYYRLLPLPPGGKPCRPYCPRLDRTTQSAGGRRCWLP